MPSPSPIQLVFQENGPSVDRVAAVEALGLSGPFTIINPISFVHGSVDANTRISVFVENLFLLSGETNHDVKVRLVDHDNQVFEFDPESVGAVPGFPFSQVTFGLPGTIALGTTSIEVKWHGETTPFGTLVIRRPKPILEVTPLRGIIFLPENCPLSFRIKNIGPPGSVLDYLVSDHDDVVDIVNKSGSLDSGNSQIVQVSIQPRLIGGPFVPTQSFVTVFTPDARNYTVLPLGFRVRDSSQVAQGLIGIWTGTWSGTSRGRDFPPATTPETPVSGTWTIEITGVDTVNHTAAGTLRWTGTDAFWTYAANGPPAAPHPFPVDRTIPFGPANTQLISSSFVNCNQGHHFQLIINGANLPFPHDGYGPWVNVDMFIDSGTIPDGPTAFNANPYSAQTGDVSLSHGKLSGFRIQ